MRSEELRDEQAERANDQMVRQMEQRRRAQPERRRRVENRSGPERRAVCSFCFQPGDHPTPVQCLRALGG